MCIDDLFPELVAIEIREEPLDAIKTSLTDDSYSR